MRRSSRQRGEEARGPARRRRLGRQARVSRACATRSRARGGDGPAAHAWGRPGPRDGAARRCSCGGGRGSSGGGDRTASRRTWVGGGGHNPGRRPWLSRRLEAPDPILPTWPESPAPASSARAELRSARVSCGLEGSAPSALPVMRRPRVDVPTTPAAPPRGAVSGRGRRSPEPLVWAATCRAGRSPRAARTVPGRASGRASAAQRARPRTWPGAEPVPFRSAPGHLPDGGIGTALSPRRPAGPADRRPVVGADGRRPRRRPWTQPRARTVGRRLWRAGTSAAVRALAARRTRVPVEDARSPGAAAWISPDGSGVVPGPLDLRCVHPRAKRGFGASRASSVYLMLLPPLMGVPRGTPIRA